MLLRRRRSPDAESSRTTVSLYYASDVHGSEQCWRKFLGAGAFYGVDALVMGGDLTGKAIVPIERLGDGTHRAVLLGAVRFNGMYPWVADADEVARHKAEPEARAALFEQVMLDELRRWIALAD